MKPDGGRASYEDALRDALRAEPGLLFVGEVRDREAAESCLVAAKSGHLVFATVCAADGDATLRRLAAEA